MSPKKNAARAVLRSIKFEVGIRPQAVSGDLKKEVDVNDQFFDQNNAQNWNHFSLNPKSVFACHMSLEILADLKLKLLQKTL